jgi:hypothetical protein
MSNKYTRLALLTSFLGFVPAAPAVALEVPVRITGQMTAANPAPTSGPFVGAAVGDLVVLDLIVNEPGAQHPQFDARGYAIQATRSFLRVGTREDSLDPVGAPVVGIWNSYLGLRDWFDMPSEPLSQGGLVRFDLVDSTDTVFDTSDILLLRGVYPASRFTTVSFGAQVGGGFLEFSVTQAEIGNGGLGTVYCAPAVMNSTGSAALMQVIGSDVLAANTLTLQARRLPPNTFGFFLTSRTQANVVSPGGSQGRLCLGGAIGRYQNSVQSSGPTGSIALAVSPLELPQPTGAVAAQVGETWNFQAWYRDANPQNTSNFSDAVAVTFL